MALIHFDEVLGQDKAKELLRLAFSRGRTSHAYLFHGPPGVGKKMLAQAFAAFLLCQGEATRAEGCGHCPACRKMLSDNHPDLVVLRPEGSAQIKIDQVRALKKNLAYAPVEGGYRVVLLADIHQTMARAEVANSLLKTLEEPPAQTVFILTAVEAAGILPTIVSRCQGIPFYPLPTAAVRERLLADGLPADSAWALVALADGSLGRARDLAQADLLALWPDLIQGLVELRRDQSGAVERVFALAEQAAQLKDELDALLGLLQIWLKTALLQVAGGQGEEQAGPTLGQAVLQASRRWTAAQLFDKLERIAQARRQLRHNCTRALVCEVLFWGLLAD